MSAGRSAELIFKSHGITPQCQHIANIKEVKVDQRIFCVLFCKTTTNKVWYSFHTILMHDSCTNAYSTWAFPDGRFFIIATFMFCIDNLFPVIGNINKGRFEFHQGIEEPEYITHAATLERRKNFKRH